jgi:large subunit ribosomal protein L24
MFVDPESGLPTRLGVRFLPDGSKERYGKKSGKGYGVIGVAKQGRAASKV